MAQTFATGSKLNKLFEKLNPFTQDLSLKPEGRRKTILAANANYPLELEISAYFAACSQNGGSPLIVQFSGKVLGILGKGMTQETSYLKALGLGAKLARATSEIYREINQPPFVALALDHFAVPEARNRFRRASREDKSVLGQFPIPSSVEIKRMLEDAVDAASCYGITLPSKDELARWTEYLASFEYLHSVAGFLTVIEEMRPAWAMIDTGEIPPALNLAVTRQVNDLVKANGYDTLVEAEYGAVGQAGEAEEYIRLEGEELQRFARQVAGFVKYTGARGISYPIGMEHAAPSAEKHEPDVKRLEVVQREIIKVTGRYVPFAQHGGTGAKKVARGLVGKNNVNTYFLVTAARHLMNHVLENRKAIEQGKKSACNSAVYLSTAKAVMEATVKKLKECGTYGILISE